MPLPSDAPASIADLRRARGRALHRVRDPFGTGVAVGKSLANVVRDAGLVPCCARWLYLGVRHV
jgi:hypothetical protein